VLTAYIAAPLFNQAEKAFNLTVDAELRAAGLKTYLPQRDAGEGAAMVARGMDPAEVRDTLFRADIDALRACDLLVMILDGRVPDEGACVELGIAYALNKPCFGLQTDIRRFADQSNNLMIDAILDTTVHTVQDLVRLLNHIQNNAVTAPGTLTEVYG
jgi:nucleoside 2-deoxyribosyltransferase